MDRQDEDKVRFSQFCSQSKYGLNIKAKAAKIFTFLQAEVVSSQNNCTCGPLSNKFS
jgi:hypothetical protein